MTSWANQSPEAAVQSARSFHRLSERSRSPTEDHLKNHLSLQITLVATNTSVSREFISTVTSVDLKTSRRTPTLFFILNGTAKVQSGDLWPMQRLKLAQDQNTWPQQLRVWPVIPCLSNPSLFSAAVVQCSSKAERFNFKYSFLKRKTGNISTAFSGCLRGLPSQQNSLSIRSAVSNWFVKTFLNHILFSKSNSPKWNQIQCTGLFSLREEVFFLPIKPIWISLESKK